MIRSRPVLTIACVLLALTAAADSAAQRFPEEPPYIPTEMELVDAMLRLGGVGPHDLLFDLGSGDGRIVIEAARRFGTRGVGYEHQEALVELSRARADSAGVGHLARFLAGDLFEADLSDATVVMLYLGAAFNLRLRPLLLSRLAPGARVVSNTFHMGEWEPDSVLRLGSGATRSVLHLWVVPARVDGFWNFAVEGEEDGFALELRQHFQRADGALRGRRGSFDVTGARLRGDSIAFRAALVAGGGTAAFEGRVIGDRMEGTVRSDTGTRRWIALRFTHPGLAPDGAEATRGPGANSER